MSPDPDRPSPPAWVRRGGPSGERPCPMVDRMLLLAGARPSWRVGVVGPARAAAMIALCRKGFDQAMSVQGAVRPSAEGGCDLMLVTGPSNAQALGASAQLAIGLLREGGVLVAHEGGLKDDSLIADALRACGRQAGWRVHDMAEGCLVALQVLRAESVSVSAAPSATLAA